jgi:hypothetical protein
MKWIEEEENLLKIQRNHPKESMVDIRCIFVYINKHDYIEQVVTDREPVVNDCITKERVLRLVEERRHSKPNARYVFRDACIFLVDLTPEQIPMFSQDETNGRFLNQLVLLEDIHVPPSIFIFHDVNAVYFFFYEEDIGVLVPPKSILNKGGCRSTKRVSYSNNKTRKKL